MTVQTNCKSDYEACAIIEGFDGDEHNADEVIDAFQHLINTGAAWSLQGFYGRSAARLIEQGLRSKP
jgi:hypothetical protein